MKKSITILLIAVLALSLFAGCAKTGDKTDENTPASADASPESGELQKIVVGATPVPHADILAAVKEILAKQGYDLEIVEFTDYVKPNMALFEGELDANYFQHKPHLDDFNINQKADMISLGEIHYEPLGIYPGKTKTIEDLKDGAQIAVPADTSNEARALLLLEAQGLIKLKEDAGLSATINDIAENPKNLKIIEIEAAQLARSLQDVDIAVINGNYALQAGLNVSTDALAKEEKDSVSAATYTNIVAVRKGDENREDLKAFIAALQSDEIKKFIEEKYQGSVVPVF